MNIAHGEINFQRLLYKCEELADKQETKNWRLEKVCFYSKKKIQSIS